MAEQITLTNAQKEKLNSYLTNLFGTDNWKPFITNVEQLAGNPEGFKSALQAKDTVKQVAGKLVKIAESLGKKVSADKMEKVASFLVESLLNEEEEVIEETPQEEIQAEKEEEVKEETKEAVDDKLADILLTVDELKLKIKALELDKAGLENQLVDVNNGIANDIESVIESAIPSMIEIAKKQLLESNSSIKIKLEMFDAISKIMGVDEVSKKLSESMDTTDFLRNFIKIQRFRTSRMVNEGKSDITKVNDKNVVSMERKIKESKENTEDRKALLSKIAETLTKQIPNKVETKPQIQENKKVDNKIERLKEMAKNTSPEDKEKIDSEVKKRIQEIRAKRLAEKKEVNPEAQKDELVKKMQENAKSDMENKNVDTNILKETVKLSNAKEVDESFDDEEDDYNKNLEAFDRVLNR